MGDGDSWSGLLTIGTIAAPSEPVSHPTLTKTGPYQAVICSFCLLLIAGGCGQKPAPLPSTSNKPTPYFKTPFQDESEFIVETVLANLTEMIVYARQASKGEIKVSVDAAEKPESTFGTPVYLVEVLPGPAAAFKTQLQVNGPIWSPAIYEQFAAKIAQHVGLARRAATQPTALPPLAEKLLDFTPTVLEAENQRLSKLLNGDFTSPDLHEQAALLLGALALREFSYEFYDIRSILCRITSHLAFANLIRGQPRYSQDGLIADAVLCGLMNNQAAALEKIKAIDQAIPAAPEWCRALRARITCDYRELDKQTQRAGIERVMYFYAMTKAIGGDAARKKLDGATFSSAADFSRIAHGPSYYSVGFGHELLKVALTLELAEAAAAYKAFHGTELKTENLVAALNHLPQRSISKDGIRIIDWGTWALFLQRHLCMCIAANFDFIDGDWGVPEHAKKFSAQSKAIFGGLKFYPLVGRATCTDEQSYRTSVNAGWRITIETPHLVPPTAFNRLFQKSRVAPLYLPTSNPHVNEWHKHNPPPGTAYDPVPRMDHPSLTGRKDMPQLMDKLHQLAPYDGRLTYHLIRIKYQNSLTYEQASELYAPLLDYSSRCLHAVACRAEYRQRDCEALLTRAVAMDTSFYAALGEHYLYYDQHDKAIKAFEKMVELDSDTVAGVDNAPWMVRYFFDHGMKDKAAAIADLGAEVYSYSGLRAKVLCLELSGKYDEALTWCKKIDERYEEKNEVAAFYARYKAATRSSKYDTVAVQSLKTLFPMGVERVTLNHFKTKPTRGVLLNGNSVLSRKAGLAKGDIIVALYGIRVHNFAQYEYARKATNEPEMQLIVWKPIGGYVEVKASPPDHRFEVEMGNYPK
jgi:tetratricopeptide (TPR) repeat protein